MIATSIEQSKHLLSLGLDPKTADMVYLFEDKEYPCVLKEPDYLDGSDTLAWSLSALLEVIPAHLKGWPADEDERLTLAKYHRMDADGPCYVINYSNPLNGSFAFPKLAHNPVTAAYEMVCWLLEQGLIMKGGNDD